MKNPDSSESLLDNTLDSRGATVGNEIKAMSGKLGENMKVAKLTRFENLDGRVGGYIHHDGKSGALISLTTDRPAEQVDAFLRSLGMHIAAIQPVALTRDEIPAETIARERSVIRSSGTQVDRPNCAASRSAPGGATRRP